MTIPDGAGDGEQLTRDQQVTHYLDLYKQAVAVQMHFNDIEWRIRGLALTVATFALGAAGVAAKDGTRVGWVSLGTLVLVIGLLLWYAFYFVDRVWYHPLLKAAVSTGTDIENEIKKSLPVAAMTATITERSEYETKRVVRLLSRRKVMHSDDKLVWFYKIGATALAGAAICLQVGVSLGTSATNGPASDAPTATPSSHVVTSSTVSTRHP
ncbi:hypothetical protein [Luteipulveratus halotolerans]|uniref:hypothetical protein n=1 Tax=Luteipulveratus halotolerans TaxID=1631356 RepID=UPI0008FBF545|nr:hypothetical protein [Luteipulveratus halotolerans]